MRGSVDRKVFPQQAPYGTPPPPTCIRLLLLNLLSTQTAKCALCIACETCLYLTHSVRNCSTVVQRSLQQPSRRKNTRGGGGAKQSCQGGQERHGRAPRNDDDVGPSHFPFQGLYGRKHSGCRPVRHRRPRTVRISHVSRFKNSSDESLARESAIPGKVEVWASHAHAFVFTTLHAAGQSGALSIGACIFRRKNLVWIDTNTKQVDGSFALRMLSFFSVDTLTSDHCRLLKYARGSNVLERNGHRNGIQVVRR